MPAASGVTLIDIDPLTILIILAVVAVVGYVAYRAYASFTRTTPLMEKRGIMKDLFNFNRLPTVPTIRVVSKGGLIALELGKRARLRENSLKDSMDKKGWDIEGSPIPIIEGKNIELGYITHPSGCTVELKPNVKIIKADDEGNAIIKMVPMVDETGAEVKDKEGKPVMVEKPEYIEIAFEGIIGTHSDLDDFNESTEREVSRGWVVPLLVGIIAGVVFFAPLFAYLMSWVAGAGR